MARISSSRRDLIEVRRVVGLSVALIVTAQLIAAPPALEMTSSERVRRACHVLTVENFQHERFDASHAERAVATFVEQLDSARVFVRKQEFNDWQQEAAEQYKEIENGKYGLFERIRAAILSRMPTVVQVAGLAAGVPDKAGSDSTLPFERFAETDQEAQLRIKALVADRMKATSLLTSNTSQAVELGTTEK